MERQYEQNIILPEIKEKEMALAERKWPCVRFNKIWKHTISYEREKSEKKLKRKILRPKTKSPSPELVTWWQIRTKRQLEEEKMEKRESKLKKELNRHRMEAYA